MGTALVSLVAGLSAWACLAGACFGAIGCYSIRIANQWERVVILRLEKYNRQVGPGLYFIIPIIEYAAAHVDQRIITTPFIAEEALTADLVPLDIDAVLSGWYGIRKVRASRWRTIHLQYGGLPRQRCAMPLAALIWRRSLLVASKLTRKSKAYLTRKRTAGELPLFRLKSGILPYRLTCKTPCRKRRRPNVKETLAFARRN